MSQFELGGNPYYRLSKKGSKTINNNIMSDALAIEFLSIDPSRIRLFSEYPQDWEDMIEALNIEEDFIKEDKVVEPVKVEEPVKIEDEKAKREALRAYKMYELRDMYPNIKETSKEDFITLVLNQE